MNTRKEIQILEERLREAELAPDPETFEELLADNAVLVDQSGNAAMAKSKVVEAHRPGKGPKFTEVTMSDLKIVDHGSAAVVTCTGHFTGPQFAWHRKDGRWQIVAGSIHQ